MNLAIGLARQGIDVAFITSLGADRYADTIERRLVHEGVDVYTPRRAGRTCTATATLDDRGTPSYDFDLTWMLDDTDTPAGVPDVVHFGSLGSALQPGADQVDELVAQYRGDALVTYDPNIRPRIDPDRDAARARVDRHAALSDIVKASDEDLAYVHPELVADPADIAHDVREAMIESTIARWLAAGTSLVVITRAEHGIDMATAQTRLHIPGHHPRVVDTIGGGDAFMAGLIAGLDVVGLFGADRARHAEHARPAHPAPRRLVGAAHGRDHRRPSRSRPAHLGRAAAAQSGLELLGDDGNGEPVGGTLEAAVVRPQG